MMKKNFILTIACTILVAGALHGQENRPQPSEAEIARMKEAMPKTATVKPAKPRNVLVYVDTKGFYHTSIPFATKALELIGEQTGAFKVADVSGDPSVFEPENLKKYDVIVLNNNTSRLPLGGVDTKKMEDSPEKQAAEAREMRLRSGLLDFVRTEGKGILGIHAAIDAMYDWPEYGEMMGGYFNLHPWSERVGVELVDPGHPLMAGWRGCPFYVRDEIYQVKEPYSRDNLRVLMRLDTQRTNMNKGDAIRRDDGDFALAWLKRYGKGRVVYIGLGHYHELFWNPGMLQMLCDSVQYCAGDLKCDERPSNQLDEAYLKASAKEGFERGLKVILENLSQYKYSIDDTEARQVERLVNDAEAPDQRDRARILAAGLASLLKPTSSVDARNFALRQLSRIGAASEVAAIASQLSDEDTAVMSLYALQRIGGAEADRALIAGLASVPKQRIGIALTLGHRRCAAAVPALKPLLADASCGSEVAIALGMIGTKDALDALTEALPVAKGDLRKSIIFGMVDCLGMVPEADCVAASNAILNAADSPANARAAAQATLFKAAGAKADAAAVTACLTKGDLLMKSAVAKALPSMGDALPAVVKSISTLPADSICLVMAAIASSKSKGFESALIDLLGHADDSVSVVASRTLTEVGDVACVLPLAVQASKSEGSRQAAARRALGRIVGEAVGAKVRSEVANESNDVAIRTELVMALGTRIDKESVPLLAKCALSEDKNLRREAISSMALVAGEKDLPVLVDLLTKTKGSADRGKLMNQVINVGKRASDQAAASGIVLKALDGKLATPVRVSLLEALGKLAHSSALPTLTEAAASQDAAVKRIAILALGEWPTPEPLDTLRGLSRDDKASLAHKVLALRGYARMLALPSSRPIPKTLEMYKEAFALAKGAQEKGSLINGLGFLVHPDALKYAMTFLDDPEVATEAAMSASRILNSLSGESMKLTASHNNGAVRNAIDGNTKTRWTSGASQAGGEWFMIDMGYETTLSELKLFAGEVGNDFPVGYQVFVSLDGEKWGDKPVLEGKGTDRHMVLKLPDVYGRYIKIVQTGTGGMYWSICEMQMNGMPATYGERLDPATLKVTSDRNPDKAFQAMDGKNETRWDTAGAQRPGFWFMIELPEAKNVRRIVLDAGTSREDYPRGYKVEVSADGKTWKGPYGAGNGTNQVVDIKLLENKSKFVKITLTEPVDPFYWSIHEFSIYAE